MRALATRLQALAEPLPDDRRIRMAVFDELYRHKWGAQVAQLDVTVEDGVVTLWGIVHSQEQKMAVRVTAENTPGVKRVEDHLEDVTATTTMVPLAYDRSLPRRSAPRVLPHPCVIARSAATKQSPAR